AASTVAFLLAFLLFRVTGEYHFTLLVRAVALVCWRKGWQAGLFSMAAGTAAVLLLLPPPFSLQVDSPSDVARVATFFLTSALICSITFALSQRSAQLEIAARNCQYSECWLQTAQQLTRFWTWEIDPETQRMKWVNPYNELTSRVSAPLDLGLAEVPSEDRRRFSEAICKAVRTGKLEVEFRSVTAGVEQRLLAKGTLVTDVVTRAPRLIVITMELPTEPRDRSINERTLQHLEDLLHELERSPSLDTTTKLNISLARSVLARVAAPSN